HLTLLPCFVQMVSFCKVNNYKQLYRINADPYMDSNLILLVITSYFLLLFLISWFTTRKISSQSFFTGDRQSPWFLVAFGMIGASLSGVTFISVPGEVGNSNFYYFQVILG